MLTTIFFNTFPIRFVLCSNTSHNKSYIILVIYKSFNNVYISPLKFQLRIYITYVPVLYFFTYVLYMFCSICSLSRILPPDISRLTPRWLQRTSIIIILRIYSVFISGESSGMVIKIRRALYPFIYQISLFWSSR